jgi:hypothetical protein
MRIIEERTKVKDSDNQLNNSALSGAEFATFYAKLRPKRVKSPKNRKNAKKRQKTSKKSKKGEKRPTSGTGRARRHADAHTAPASARPYDTGGRRAH